jgi:OHCU decarboxylase
MTAAEAEKELIQCCGSRQWVDAMVSGRPYASLEALLEQAEIVWWSLEQNDWLEAFRSHPKIGEKKAAEKVSAQSQQWSGQEQAGMNDASVETTASLANLNQVYEQKFGFIFIICATGKTPHEMLEVLQARLQHDAATELPIAAREQSKITKLRLKKLITSS